MGRAGIGPATLGLESPPPLRFGLTMRICGAGATRGKTPGKAVPSYSSPAWKRRSWTRHGLLRVPFVSPDDTLRFGRQHAHNRPREPRCLVERGRGRWTATVGPVVLIASGPAWTLHGWRTSDGLCVSSHGTRRAFCIPGDALRRGGAMFSCLCRQRGGWTLVVGAVTLHVAEVEASDRRGVAAVELYTPPRSLKTRLRFFRSRVSSGSPPKWRIDALNGSSKIVGSVGQGFKP